MLIFEDFSNRAAAELFSDALKTEFPDREIVICDTQEEADKHDLFPFELNPPIVMISRMSREDEDKAIEMCESFGGSCAGT